MHVLQYIAVKADSPEEAIDNVRTQLEHIMGESGSGATWYDWFITGGGRWNPESEPYTDGATNMIVSSKDSEAFEKVLAESIEARLSEFNRYRDEWNRSNVNLDSYFDEFDGTMDYSMTLYSLGKMIDMVQGEWDFNSYFYDIEHWSSNPLHMNKDRINNDTVWYLVPVDFHF
jgi:hypothetical protein